MLCYLEFILYLAIIYLLGVFTEKHYCKPLELKVAYIQITTSSHASDIKIKYGSLQSDWTSALFGS